MRANKKVAQGIRTADKLLDIAQEIFTQRGYAAATTQEVIDKAGVTKGALYHHFSSKQALFEAVYRRAETRMGERIQSASGRNEDGFEQLKAGCFAYLECCSDDKFHRILRLDGPAALGAQRWREIDREFGVHRLLPFLMLLADKQVIKVASVEAFAFQLTGAMNEATFWIAQHENPPLAMQRSKAVLAELLLAVKATS